jgi:acylphosphatase
MKKAARIIVQGTVQGIFFRQFIKGEADKLGLRGFIRNLDNGDVELIIEGDGEGIGRMSRICEKGPEHAMIKNVIVEERNWTGDFKEFKVLRM